MGHLLESEHGEKLDTLQMYLTEICKDPRVDLTIRLKVLEVIELRSLGWNSNPRLESFYQEKISKFGKKDDSSLSLDLSSLGKPMAPVVSLGESLASQPQPQSQCQVTGDNLVPDRKEQASPRECLAVNMEGETVKLFLSSSCPQLTKYAKLILFQHFTSTSSSGTSIGAGVQYSREDLLSMARSPTAREKPEDWDSVLANLPEIVRKH